jgi:hypothetical protein
LFLLTWAVVNDTFKEGNAMDNFSIFLSHRSKDALIAGSLSSILEGLDLSGSLRVNVSENIPKGEEWRKHIHEALVAADRFVLLYTDPSQKWDWCLYESGFFSGARLFTEETAAKFITLHAVDVEPPSPLSHWQTVKGDAPSVLQLLLELFCEPLREGADPIAPKLRGHKDKLLGNAADRIANLIHPGPKPAWYSSFVRVELTPEQVEALRSQGSIPDNAEIESDDSSLKLFNVRRNNGLSWARLGAAWRKRDDEELLRLWRDGVSDAIRTAIDNTDTLPQLPLFYSHDNRCYHSFLQRLDKMPDDGVRGYIVFTEFKSEDDPRPPGVDGVLTHMLTLGRNYRWGFVEPFILRFELLFHTGAAQNRINDEICKLRSAMARTLNDGARANLLSRDAAMAIFPDRADRDNVKYCYDEWRKLSPFFVQAQEHGDVNEVLRILKEFRKLNTIFLTVATKRLNERLNDMLSDQGAEIPVAYQSGVAVTRTGSGAPKH